MSVTDEGVVAEHFSSAEIVREMHERNKNGLNSWETYVVDQYFKDHSAVILDIGCGTGREAFALSDKGFRVIGIDLSEVEVALAKAEAKEHKKAVVFEAGSGLNLKYRDNSFDHIIMWAQAFGNVYGPQNQRRLLGECYRTLKPRGYFCFSGHDYGYVKCKYPQYTDGSKFYAYANTECYWELFTIAGLKSLSIEAGFQVVQCCNSVEMGSQIENQVLVCVVRKPE